MAGAFKLTSYVRGAPEASAGLRLVNSKITDAVARAMRQNAEDLIFEARRQLEMGHHNSPASGGKRRLAASIRVLQEYTERTQRRVEIVVGSDEDHAAAVEFGSRPHRPPVQNLKGWVKAHSDLPTAKKQRQQAYGLAEEIEKHGTQAMPYMGPAVALLEPGFRARIEAAINGAF